MKEKKEKKKPQISLSTKITEIILFATIINVIILYKSIKRNKREFRCSSAVDNWISPTKYS